MFSKLSESFSVMSRQLEIADIPEVATSGFMTIICNRPDDEVENQPSFQLIDQEARKHGIETSFLPLISGTFTEESVDSFSKAVANLPKPILGYCRTGTRSTILWALNEKASGNDIESIESASRAAGYDIAGFIND